MKKISQQLYDASAGARESGSLVDSAIFIAAASLAELLEEILARMPERPGREPEPLVEGEPLDRDAIRREHVLEIVAWLRRRAESYSPGSQQRATLEAAAGAIAYGNVLT